MLLSPSILSADFMQMPRAAAEMESAGADLVHCDVMDGVFVPNITFGQKMVADLKKITRLPLDVHLMIVKPERYVEEFVKSGADILTLHLEALQTPEITRAALQKVRGLGAKAGLSIKPATPVDALAPYVELLDLILIMSVEPGFSGQKFMDGSLEKIRAAKKLIGGRNIILEVDGGVTEGNAAQIAAAGATAMVAGNAFFKSPDKPAAAKNLKCE